MNYSNYPKNAWLYSVLQQILGERRRGNVSLETSAVYSSELWTGCLPMVRLCCRCRRHPSRINVIDLSKCNVLSVRLSTGTAGPMWPLLMMHWTSPNRDSPKTCSNLFNMDLTVQGLLDMFKLAHCGARTVGKWAVDILLECFLVLSCDDISSTSTFLLRNVLYFVTWKFTRNCSTNIILLTINVMQIQ